MKEDQSEIPGKIRPEYEDSTARSIDNGGSFQHIFAPLELGLVGYSSGQRGQTVNLLAYASAGSNPAPTTIS